jgi:predicted nucleic acid-binding Zn ribbon protein
VSENKLDKTMERSNTQSIAEAIRAYLKESKLEKPLKERQLVRSWETLLGKSVSRATSKIYLKDGKLFVHLNSSVVKNELFMLQDEIIKKLNDAAGEDLVREIVLR